MGSGAGGTSRSETARFDFFPLVVFDPLAAGFRVGFVSAVSSEAELLGWAWTDFFRSAPRAEKEVREANNTARRKSFASGKPGGIQKREPAGGIYTTIP